MDFSEETIEAYLLKQLDADTSQAIATQTAVDDELSEYIEAIHLALVNDYLQNQLTPPQRTAFEQLLAEDATTQDLLANQQTIDAAFQYQRTKETAQEAQERFKTVLAESIQHTDLDWDNIPLKEKRTSTAPPLSKSIPIQRNTRWRSLFVGGLAAAAVGVFLFFYNPFQNLPSEFAFLEKIEAPPSLPKSNYVQQEEQVGSAADPQVIEENIRMAYLIKDYAKVVQLSEGLLQTGTIKQKDYGAFALATVAYRKQNYAKAIERFQNLKVRIDSELYLPRLYYLGMAQLKISPPNKMQAQANFQKLSDTLSKYPSDHPDQIYKTAADKILAQLKS